MDLPGLPEQEVADAYRILGRVNRTLGNLRTLRGEVRRFLAEDRPAGPVSVLDVGSGGGDLPQAIRPLLGSARLVALDRDQTAATMARRSAELDVVQGDALRLPFGDRAFDLVTAVKFAHHFWGPDLDRLLTEMARVARRRLVVLDIRRDWLAYLGFVAWSRVFTRNRLVRADGALSVLRGFTPDELGGLATALPGFAWEVRVLWGYQLVLVGRRLDA